MEILIYSKKNIHHHNGLKPNFYAVADLPHKF